MADRTVAVPVRALYAIPEAMVLLSLSRTQIYELIRSDRLLTMTQGRRRLVPAEAISAYVALLLSEAAQILADRWIGHRPVVDGGKLVGVISQRDPAGVLAGALNEPEAVQQLVEASELIRERWLRRIEHGVWD